MNQRTLAFLMAVLMTGATCLALAGEAVINEDFRPSTLNQPGQEYPQVNSQGYARFRVVAPDAKAVVRQPRPGWSWRHAARQGDDGAWTGTTAGPLDEGFHYYHLYGGRGHVQRSRHVELLRFHPLGKRHRDSGPRPRLLRAQGCAPRPGAADSFPVEEHGHRAPRVRLHAARLRQGPQQALSGAVPAAWLGRGRNRLEQPGPCQPDHGQPAGQRERPSPSSS